jgi:ABC-type glycerol-3-phosphate transport system permease component
VSHALKRSWPRATIVTLPVVVFSFFVQRHFIAGMLAGAVK